jgi:hypothetical protein
MIMVNYNEDGLDANEKTTVPYVFFILGKLGVFSKQGGYNAVYRAHKRRIVGGPDLL